jgi:hypothetical protein
MQGPPLHLLHCREATDLMGCNYYVESFPECPHCGAVAERLHLGKSSNGWAFLFRAYPHLQTWIDWEDMIMSGSYIIKDEEDRIILLMDFVDRVLKSKDDHKHPELGSESCWLDQNGLQFTDEEFS